MKNIEIFGTSRNEIKTIKVNDKPQVVVSSHFESAERLYDIVTANGFSAYFTSEKWPRDIFNSFNDKYIFYGIIDFLGRGGEFVYGNDFGLASRGNVNLFKKNPYVESGFRSAFQRTKLDAAEKFFDVPLYGMCVPRKQVKTCHIDTAVMIIPSRNYVLVDQSFYDATNSFNNIDKITKKHKQELIKIPSLEYQLLPLNCLVLERNGEPFVVANKRTPTLLGILNDLGVDYETVEATDSPIFGNGSIRCRTNVVASKQVISMANMNYHKNKKRVKCERKGPLEGRFYHSF